ncbi:hypothetical protein V6N13_029219 [Hibiscus sabdariffa]
MSKRARRCLRLKEEFVQLIAKEQTTYSCYWSRACHNPGETSTADLPGVLKLRKELCETNEVIKAISGKGDPLKNFFIFDAMDGKGLIALTPVVEPLRPP